MVEKRGERKTHRVSTNLVNMETWKTQGIRKIVKISGKTQRIFVEKPGKLKENVRYMI